jgi:hypothetical protein
MYGPVPHGNRSLEFTPGQIYSCNHEAVAGEVRLTTQPG